jgi:hypothetical protein
LQIYRNEEEKVSQSQAEPSNSSSQTLDDMEASQSLHLCMEETQAVARSPPDMFQVDGVLILHPFSKLTRIRM